MKRFLILLLALAMLAGCSFSPERHKEPVNFYYLKSEFSFEDEKGVILSEEREAAGHLENPAYLLALYRMGPASEELRLPFPPGTTILLSEQTETSLKLTLGSQADVLTDAEFTLAGACLTLTCIDLTGVTDVTIVNGSRSVTMNRDTITLFDGSSAEPTEEPT